MFWDNLFDRNERVDFYTQKSSYIAEGSVILVQKTKKSVPIPCEVQKVSKTLGKDPSYKYVCRDIFTGERHNHQVKVNGECRCPFVYDSEYEIVDISTDGQLTLATEFDGEIRPPLSLPDLLPPAHKPNDPSCECDDDCGDDCHLDFIPRYIERLEKGKLLYANVKSAMGKEQVMGITQWKNRPRAVRPILIVNNF